jgi:methyl-accepting chemotaxis protein
MTVDRTPATVRRTGPRHLHRAITTVLVVAGLVPLLLGVALVGYQSATAARTENHHSAQREAGRAADIVQRAFSEWRNELLVAAQDDALKQVFREPGRTGGLRPAVEAELVGISSLYPDLVDEACFISAAGPEIARTVHGKVAPEADLSPDESGNPFFTPTLALAAGQVHQHGPYVSPDSDRWVVSNSTPIVVDGKNVALLHYEINLDALRLRLAGTLPAGAQARIVDTASGLLILNTADRTPIGKEPLAKAADVAPIAGNLSRVSAVVPAELGNVNQWRIDIGLVGAPIVKMPVLAELAGFVIVVGVLLVLAASRYSASLVRPIQRLAERVTALADGDLSGRLMLGRRDELGALGDAVDRATDSLAGTIRAITGEAGALGTAVDRLHAVSATLNGQADTTAAESATMSNAAEAMATSVEALSGGVHDLGEAMLEIAENANQASTVAAAGTRIAHEGAGQVNELVAAAGMIDDVVAVIASVAGQTRLLALNATIEAARAGEHGHGFAVVADEVKQLADQTSQATEQIRSRIEAVRQAAAAAAEAMGRINETIVEVDRAQGTIAQSVQAQSANSRATASGVDAVAAGTRAMAAGTGTVVHAVAEAKSAAGDTAVAAETVARSATQLRTLVGHFRIGDR